ncbi:MAG: DNA gyrase/topoisomerase IV subunit A, partial [Xanthomarina gelatinilytica]|nr:DNA gyrase/topoisomerase IV subunit A [Xanthomarina gelatinilytica]
WRPMAEVEFTKERGKDRKDNMEVNFEEFIAVKGITAQGNQLTKDKINQVSLLDPLPYEAPEETPAEDIEVVDETDVSNESKSNKSNDPSKKTDQDKGDSDSLDGKGQITLF